MKSVFLLLGLFTATATQAFVPGYNGYHMCILRAFSIGGRAPFYVNATCDGNYTQYSYNWNPRVPNDYVSQVDAAMSQTAAIFINGGMRLANCNSTPDSYQTCYFSAP